MLADEGLAIAEAIGEHDRFAVLAENVCIGARRRMNGLDEESELEGALHGGLLVRRLHRTESTNRKPPPALPTGAWMYVLVQALAGAVLPDNDDYNATQLESAISHRADAITRETSEQGAQVRLPIRASLAFHASWSIFHVAQRLAERRASKTFEEARRLWPARSSLK